MVRADAIRRELGGDLRQRSPLRLHAVSGRVRIGGDSRRGPLAAAPVTVSSTPHAWCCLAQQMCWVARPGIAGTGESC